MIDKKYIIMILILGIGAIAYAQSNLRVLDCSAYEINFNVTGKLNNQTIRSCIIQGNILGEYTFDMDSINLVTKTLNFTPVISFDKKCFTGLGWKEINFKSYDERDVCPLIKQKTIQEFKKHFNNRTIYKNSRNRIRKGGFRR